MGTTQSRDFSSPPPESSAESNAMLPLNANENESDDEFSDCTDKFEDLNTINDDEIVKNSKPLESSSKANDDVVRGKIVVSRKQYAESDDDESLDDRRERQRKEMEDFREEMNKKREMRQQCIKKLREELSDLREKLSSEMDTNQQLREAMESQGSLNGTKSFDDLNDENKKLKADLAECQMFLQTSNSENLNSTFENQALRDQVRSLKEVITAVKEMLKIRESQVDQMKAKLTEIESSFAERETKILSSKLQQEYQRQLENIRNMRQLYEERANMLTRERDTIKQKLEEKEHDLKTEVEK